MDLCSRERVKRPGEAERENLFVNRLGPVRLHELAGEDLRFCLDMTGRAPGELRELDFVVRAIQFLPTLGISGAAGRDAVDAMGDVRAALCVLVTDANCDHPATPIRKPGGHLRAHATPPGGARQPRGQPDDRAVGFEASPEGLAAALWDALAGS